MYLNMEIFKKLFYCVVFSGQIYKPPEKLNFKTDIKSRFTFFFFIMDVQSTESHLLKSPSFLHNTPFCIKTRNMWSYFYVVHSVTVVCLCIPVRYQTVLIAVALK